MGVLFLVGHTSAVPGVVPGIDPREEAVMTVQMSRAEWQAAQYRHRMADGRPAIVRWAAGVGTVLEPVEFTDDAPYGVWLATLPDGSQVLVELDDGELTVATRERADGMWSESVVAEDVA